MRRCCCTFSARAHNMWLNFCFAAVYKWTPSALLLLFAGANLRVPSPLQHKKGDKICRKQQINQAISPSPLDIITAPGPTRIYVLRVYIRSRDTNTPRFSRAARGEKHAIAAFLQLSLSLSFSVLRKTGRRRWALCMCVCGRQFIYL